MKHNCWFLGISIFLFGQCKKPEQPYIKPKVPTYFSVRQFTEDQVRTYFASPFMMNKYVTFNGNKDSSYVSSYAADWGEIFKIFFATDIGQEKFLGQYDVSLFDDESSWAKVLYYTAKDENLFTKTLQIRIEPETKKVLSIYIETSKRSFWRSVSQKLYYVPMKLIQIQEFEKPFIGGKKELRVDYKMGE